MKKYIGVSSRSSPFTAAHALSYQKLLGRAVLNLRYSITEMEEIELNI